MKQLAELLKNVEILKINGPLTGEITGVYYDSRKVKPGGIFVAITGFKTDGHEYIDQAILNGALVIIVEREISLENSPVVIIQVKNTRLALASLAAAFYDFPSRNFNLIGVTGTNGKTSFTYLLRSILRYTDQKVGLIGTIANYIEEQEIETKHTTPEASDLQELFGEMAKQDVNYTVMEVSSHALELERVASSEFDVAVFTNLTQDHLDFHPSLEHYFQAKAKLFSGLAPGSKQRKKYAVLNFDEEHYAQLKEQCHVPSVSYGLKDGATYQAKNIELKLKGIKYDLCGPFGRMTLNLNLAGIFSVYNSLAAASVALEEGISPEKVKISLEATKGIPGRFELVDCGQDFAVVVDYAHTSDSLENVLKTAREVADGKVIVVFGCGGDRDNSKRPLMGEKAALFSDLCIITSDNPRSENPARIIEQIKPGVEKIKGNNYQSIIDRQEAIEAAISSAEKGDIVVIAGKGHENYQILADKTIHFDDVEVAKAALLSK